VIEITNTDRITGTKSLVGLVAWVALCLFVGLLASLSQPGDWYDGLSKPSWTPPGSVFGPVWAVLYIMAGVAAWLVWKRGGADALWPLVLFGVQLVFNAAWMWLFFDLHLPAIAMLDMVLLWVAVAATIVVFDGWSRAAAILLLPYLIFVSFAALLNFSLWRLNV